MMQKQFDPAENFDSIAEEVDALCFDLTAKLDRLKWLRGKIAEQIARAQTDADRLELFTEAEAGLTFKLNSDPTKAERAMADLRRRHDFPHVRAGREIRYTREQLREVAALLEMNSKPRRGENRSRHLKAA